MSFNNDLITGSATPSNLSREFTLVFIGKLFQVTIVLGIHVVRCTNLVEWIVIRWSVDSSSLFRQKGNGHMALPCEYVVMLVGANRCGWKRFGGALVFCRNDASATGPVLLLWRWTNGNSERSPMHTCRWKPIPWATVNMSVRLSYLSLILLIFSYDSQCRKIVVLRIAPLCGNRVEDKTDWCIAG